MSNQPEIIVAGSINMDIVVQTNRIPEPGETIKGNSFSLIPGGKGANQAVAAAHAGSTTAMIACVGDDSFGPFLVEKLNENKVNTSLILTCKDTPSGTATIMVDKQGENRIIIVPGANDQLNETKINKQRDSILHSKMVITQFEIPFDTVFHIGRMLKDTATKFVINPAPAREMPDELLSLTDILILNETEAQIITKTKVKDVQTALQAGQLLNDRGVQIVILTLGEKGAVLVSASEKLHVPAIPVQVIDTTAAGDSFVGAFCAFLVENKPVREALKAAVCAGSLAVSKLGAQPSIPYRQKIINHISKLEIFELKS